MGQAFLLTGPEFGEKNDYIEEIKSSLIKKFGSVEQYLFYASETPAFEFMSILQNESLFSEANFVLVKNAESLKKKEEVQIVADWVKSPSSGNSVLVLVSDEISVDSKIEKAFPPANKKIFWEMYEDKKLPWLKSFFSKNGYSLTDEAGSLILELIENNTAALKNECSRFFVCFPKGTQITEDEVDQILTHTREENAFSLFEVIVNSKFQKNERFAKALEILEKIRLSKENSSVLIIAALSSCFRKVVLFHTLQSSNQTDDFNLKINGFSSAKIKKQYSSAAKVYSRGQAVGILSILAETDMNIRASGTFLEDVYLKKMLYEIIIKGGSSSAKYD